MSDTTSKFVWYELATTDTAGAEAFYTNVIGWRMADSGMPSMAYTLISAGDTMVGGMMAMPDAMAQAGGRPAWMGYISVDDVDAAADRLAASGGAIHRAPDNIPTVGRFAVVADPQGATFTLFKPASDAQPAQPAPGTPGLVGWHELHAADWASAFDFYAGQFGWTKGDTLRMGPNFTYQLFATGEFPVGAVLNTSDMVTVPLWLYYINVEDIDAAAARVKASGGQVLNGPHQVPGGSWIVHARDPQGGMFAILGPRT